MISHDRCLMDRVCTQRLGLGGTSEEKFFADYSQWEKANKPKPKIESVEKALPKKQPKKLSYKEKIELSTMEESILQLEKEIESLQQKLESLDVSSQLELYNQLGEAQKKHDSLFERWQDLIDRSDEK